ncbi:MAG: hypothetical protein K6C68_05015 [Ruminococcus sp.]|nr:hypothetical protein [Ruminococcus sp.]
MVDIYVNDIEKALKSESYFSALALSLALPDICGEAEYPKEGTGKRYIEWYDKYVSPEMNCEQDEIAPYLSGEVVYNLRNTFLHTGSAIIKSTKIKNERNQVDQFLLILGDDKGLLGQSISMYVYTSIAELRQLAVNVTWLCKTICEQALSYYKQNKDKFSITISAVHKKHLEKMNRESDGSEFQYEKHLIDAINKKLERTGSNDRIVGFIADSIHENISTSYDESKQNLSEQGNIIFNNNGICIIKSEQICTKNKQTEPDKREEQISSFFDQNFKEEKYKQKKEDIIRAIKDSKTKQQVNLALMKIFPSEETGVIYKRIKPLIKDLPGDAQSIGKQEGKKTPPDTKK